MSEAKINILCFSASLPEDEEKIYNQSNGQMVGLMPVIFNSVDPEMLHILNESPMASQFIMVMVGAQLRVENESVSDIRYGSRYLIACKTTFSEMIRPKFDGQIGAESTSKSVTVEACFVDCKEQNMTERLARHLLLWYVYNVLERTDHVEVTKIIESQTVVYQIKTHNDIISQCCEFLTKCLSKYIEYVK